MTRPRIELQSRSLSTRLLIAGLGMAAIVYSCGPSKEDTQAKIRADVAHLKTGLSQFAADHGGRYPAALDELVEGERAYPRTYGPRPEVPRDPWDNNYAYTAQDEGKSFELRCYGSDGSPGGEGDAADLSL